jgi:ABC-type transport system involved in multi-copper enzyme maturation permease subunit
MAAAHPVRQAKSRARVRKTCAWFLLLIAPCGPILSAIADLPVWFTILSAAPALVALPWLVVEYEGWRLIGPHCYFDLIRMARKGRTILLRVAFLLALLGGIWYAYDINAKRQLQVTIELRNLLPEHQTDHLALGESRNLLARFNTECVYTWFLLQNLTILLLTPAYVGGAIAEERERGTLELLHTSALYNREIALGKLAARVVHLGAFLLAGLPVFSLMLVWGGIDFELLLGNWINSMLLLLAASSVCLMISTMPYSSTTCVVISYVVVLLFGGCCVGQWSNAWRTGIGFGDSFEGFLAMTAGYGTVIAFSLGVATIAIRPPDWPPALTESEMRHLARRAADPAALLPPMPLLMSVPAGRSPEVDPWQPPLPPVTDDALFWKEHYTGGRALVQIPEVRILGGMFIGCAFIIMLSSLFGPARTASALAWVEAFWLMYGISLVFYTLGVAYRAAGCVVRERQAQTLDMLLTLPVDRRDILRAKWLAALLKGWIWIVLLVGDVLIGAAIGFYYPCDALFLVICPVPLVLSVCSVGLLVSVAARTVLQANVVMATLLAAGTAAILYFGHGLLPGLNWLQWQGITLGAALAASVGTLALGGVAVGAWGLAAMLFERAGR